MFKNDDVENLFANESSPSQGLGIQTKKKKMGEEKDEEKEEEEYKSVPHSEAEDLSRICFRSIVQISTFSISIARIF